MKYRILFIIYTPYPGYLPKRLAEIQQKFPNYDDVGHILITPLDYLEKLEGIQADSTHLIKLIPEYDTENGLKWWEEEPRVVEMVDKIKSHNI